MPDQEGLSFDDALSVAKNIRTFVGDSGTKEDYDLANTYVIIQDTEKELKDADWKTLFQFGAKKIDDHIQSQMAHLEEIDSAEEKERAHKLATYDHSVIQNQIGQVARLLTGFGEGGSTISVDVSNSLPFLFGYLPGGDIPAQFQTIITRAKEVMGKDAKMVGITEDEVIFLNQQLPQIQLILEKKLLEQDRRVKTLEKDAHTSQQLVRKYKQELEALETQIQTALPLLDQEEERLGIPSLAPESATDEKKSRALKERIAWRQDLFKKTFEYPDGDLPHKVILDKWAIYTKVGDGYILLNRKNMTLNSSDLLLYRSPGQSVAIHSEGLAYDSHNITVRATIENAIPTFPDHQQEDQLGKELEKYRKQLLEEFPRQY